MSSPTVLSHVLFGLFLWSFNKLLNHTLHITKPLRSSCLHRINNQFQAASPRHHSAAHTISLSGHSRHMSPSTLATLFNHMWPRIVAGIFIPVGNHYFQALASTLQFVAQVCDRLGCGSSRHRQSVCMHNIHVAATCRPSVLGSATMRGHMWLNKVASVLGPYIASCFCHSLHEPLQYLRERLWVYTIEHDRANARSADVYPVFSEEFFSYKSNPDISRSFNQTALFTQPTLYTMLPR